MWGRLNGTSHRFTNEIDQMKNFQLQSKVVFPAPKKPESTVTGNLVIDYLKCFEFSEAA